MNRRGVSSNKIAQDLRRSLPPRLGGGIWIQEILCISYRYYRNDVPIKNGIGDLHDLWRYVVWRRVH